MRRRVAFLPFPPPLLLLVLFTAGCDGPNEPASENVEAPARVASVVIPDSVAANETIPVVIYWAGGGCVRAISRVVITADERVYEVHPFVEELRGGVCPADVFTGRLDVALPPAPYAGNNVLRVVGEGGTQRYVFYVDGSLEPHTP
ncbi:MAG: hypothetical protein ACREOU_09975 [Candidatus Eiseniibacteriota bacterium]